MTRVLLAELFAPSEQLTAEAIRSVVDALFRSGFEFPALLEQQQYWADIGGGIEVWAQGGLTAALSAIPKSRTWGLPLQRPPFAGGPAETQVDAMLEFCIRPPSAGLGTIALSLGSYGLAEQRPTVFGELIAWTLLLTGLIRPSYGWAGGSYGLFGSNAQPVSPTSVAATELQPIEWLNILGEPYLTRLGVDKVLGAPAWRVEFAADGSLAVILGASPTQVDRGSAAAVAEYLGLPKTF